MRKQAPGAKARSLGSELRTIRKKAKLSMADVAERTGWSESKVSRMETGLRNTEAEDVATVLAIYQIIGPERDKLIAMARTVDEPGWGETALKGLPSDSVALATAEHAAVRITNWAPLLVPGLLQTMEFTRAYMLADGISEQDIGARLMARQRRQERLPHIEYTAYLAEQVLHQRVGGTATLIAQLRHLQHVSRLPSVTIRVVSTDVDAHSGLIGSFMKLDLANAPSVVHVELRRSAVFLHGQADTYPYDEAINQLSSLSMDGEDSLRCIERCIKELESEST